jgi:hypothetical protein
MTKHRNPFRTAHHITLVILLMLGLVGCSTKNNAGIQRIALIAPFEGRYSEIGYDAYYAVRLAIKESGNDHIELLAIDDGGSKSSAAERAKALAGDPQVEVVIALGTNATQPEVQQAFNKLPVIIVGQWRTKPITENIYMLASKQLESSLTVNVSTLEEAAQAKSPILGGEIFALNQFPLISNNLDSVIIASSASLPNTDFRQRYLNGGQFVPEPGLLATLSYDAAGIALEAVQSGNPKSINSMTHKGLNGDIRFVEGYWSDAPIYYYRYDANAKLTPAK